MARSEPCPTARTRPDRTAPTSSATPIPATSSPLSTPSHRSTPSGASAVEMLTADPSNSTPTVCVAVTVAPTSSASRRVPRRPAR